MGGGGADPPPIKPAKSAYAFFQKEVGSTVHRELSASGQPTDVGALGKEVSSRWQKLSDAERLKYEEMAARDRDRFNAESHKRDVEAMARKARLQKERETLILEDQGEGYGGRATRKSRQKGQRKAEKKRAKKEEKRMAKKAAAKKAKAAAKQKKGDDDSDRTPHPSSSSSDSEDQKPAKKRPAKVSQAVLDRREQARKDKLEKERYIEGRQSDVRAERAEQAKRRLEFLLKQSDIFSHFGNVKEEKARLGASTAAQTAKSSPEKAGEVSTSAIVRKDSSGIVGEAAQEVEEEETRGGRRARGDPSTLAGGKMRQYQLEGLNWMIRLQENGVNGILADEMGLGKTMQSISILVYMMEYKADNGPHLIIVPKSTLSNWMNELARWAPNLTAVKFHGNKEERLDLANNVLQPGQRDEERQWNVCVTTYEICNIDRNFAWSYLIIDEAHRLKNEASTFSRIVRTLETRFRLLLTGTPLQNNLHELWALLNFLVPDVFASAEQFDEWFNLDIDDDQEKNKLISQLHKILRPFMLRRLKADVEKSLPPKSETILFTGMSAMQKKLYKDILMRDLDTVTGKGGAGSRTAVLNIVMQLRKCAGHPYLFPGIEDRSLDPLGEHLVENCGKMVLLDKLLVRLQERGHRMTRILDIMEDYMHMRGFQYCRIDGNTSYEDREERIDSYNKPDSEKFLFLLSTRAGGLGINLQTADVVILYDSDWNPQADLQAQDRAHRIGQKRQVQVFRLVTEDTIEQKVVERAQQKLKLDAMVVQQGRLKEKDKLSADELLDAIRFGADKIFKSKDSSITDDDIDMILNAGKQKTQELNDKLQAAQKGDMLDFQARRRNFHTDLRGNRLLRREECRVYTGTAWRDARYGQARAPDRGIQRKRAVREADAAAGHPAAQEEERPRRKSSCRKMLRLPRMDDWQMFDQKSLNALQEAEEQAFRALPEEVQLAVGGTKSTKSKEESKKPEEAQPPGEDEAKEDGTPKASEGASEAKPDAPEESKEVKEAEKAEFTLDTLPPLLTEEQEAEKGAPPRGGLFRLEQASLLGIHQSEWKIWTTELRQDCNRCGQAPTYSEAFWDEEFGKKRFTEHEYDRVVKLIEKGEKRIEDIKGLQRGTRVLISLFENPWIELQFSHANTKDKKFTAEEDRFLLCWAHKYGYGQWEAIKFAIRRSSNFRFDYFLKSLPPDAIGRRCEQLMRAAEKEVEHMEKQAAEEAEKEGRTLPPGEIQLPMWKEQQAKKRANAQKNCWDVDGVQTIDSFFKSSPSYRRKQTAELANIIARLRSPDKSAIAEEFSSKYPGKGSKASISKKIEAIGVKEKREGDSAPLWHVKPDHMHLLTKETKKQLEAGTKKRKASDAGEEECEGKGPGATGPHGNFVVFPEYDGEDEPHENKKAFTLFCKSTRKECGKGWEAWDAKRYEHQLGVYEKKRSHKPAKKAKKESPPSKDETVSVPKKSIPKKDAFSVPKKKK
ncbi:hypothetical protein ACHAXT_006707 [Thalassiosira profunda]